MSTSSVFARRRQLREKIAIGELSEDAVELLLPQGTPLDYERELWDYKLTLPSVVSGESSPNQKEQRLLQYAELVKDVVSFYNSSGGYIVAGIRDRPREFVGFSSFFNCDELNDKVRAATRHVVDCHFGVFEMPWSLGRKVGLLFIPPRSEQREPAQFLRDGVKDQSGRPVYRRGTIYLRDADACRPASSSEDYMFLCASRRRGSTSTSRQAIAVVDHNLPARDPEFVRFVGREEDLKDLWRWLCDEFSPVRLLAGLGGVGKTTLAREFVEDVRRCSPMGFEKVIWLSAKVRSFAAVDNIIKPAVRLDFENVDDMLRKLLSELGTPDEEVDEHWSRQELQEEVLAALIEIPSILVLDDLDSLTSEEQSEAFHVTLELMNRLTGRVSPPSRALLTARLELGASPGQLMRVSGLPFDAFCDYVAMMALRLGIDWKSGSKKKLLKKFHRATDGSPLFASSVLRLVRLGERLETALLKWKGHVGSDVRKFAFRRELEALSGSQIRTLYTLVCLGESSFVELQDVTESTEGLLQDDVGRLRNYHLVAEVGDVPAGGAGLTIPENIRLMSDIIRDRLTDPARIERRCRLARSTTGGLERQVGSTIHRVIALLNKGEEIKALEVARWAAKKHSHPDLQCLLGRAFLRVSPPQEKRADTALRKAHRLGCKRKELHDLWIEAKKIAGDWVGVIEVVETIPEEFVGGEHIFESACAQVELAEHALASYRREVAADWYRKVGFYIDLCFRKNLARGRVEELKDLRRRVFQEYISIMSRIRAQREEHIDVWLAVLDAFKCFVRPSRLLMLGTARLESWWEAVESREGVDLKAADLMEIQLDRLDEIVSSLEEEMDPREEVLSFLETMRDDLRGRLTEYRASLG